MRSRSFTFTGGNGDQLSGRIEMPEEEPTSYAVFAHCFTCSSNSLAAVRVSRALANEGLGVLRFDFTGLGGSEGDFGRLGLGGDTSDLIAAVNALKHEGKLVDLLVGHSFGGAAVLAAAGSLPDIRAVATIAAPFEVDHVLDLLGDAVGEIEAAGEATVNLGGRPFKIARSFIEDVRSHMEPDTLRIPLLVMHSPGDETVGIENAEQIFRAARHPKSFVSLGNADHLLSKEEDAAYAARVIAAWASAYLT